MPSPSPPQQLPPGPLRRRTALAGATAAVALATGCTHGVDRRSQPGRGPSPSPTPDLAPDVLLAARVLADEQALRDLVGSVLAHHPRLDDVLTPAADVHERHVRMLTEAVPARARPSASPSPGTAASPSVSPVPGTPAPGSVASQGPVRVPKDPRRALRLVARHEDELSLVDKRSSFTARSGAFSRVLASMAAAAAQQGAALRTAAQRVSAERATGRR